VILKVLLQDERTKRKCMRSVSGLRGIEILPDSNSTIICPLVVSGIMLNVKCYLGFKS
jgi:hypothetical protein